MSHGVQLSGRYSSLFFIFIDDFLLMCSDDCSLQMIVFSLNGHLLNKMMYEVIMYSMSFVTDLTYCVKPITGASLEKVEEMKYSGFWVK